MPYLLPKQLDPKHLPKQLDPKHLPRFDYLLRDSKMLGMMHNCIDAARIIRSARVIEDQICYEVKDADSLYDVGELRYKLHKKIYHHKTGE